jgi:hypothetical protein
MKAAEGDRGGSLAKEGDTGRFAEDEEYCLFGGVVAPPRPTVGPGGPGLFPPGLMRRFANAFAIGSSSLSIVVWFVDTVDVVSEGGT